MRRLAVAGFPRVAVFVVMSPCSYKSCLPKSHRVDIEKRNWVERFRIRNTLKRFLKMLGNCPVDDFNLKLMYLTELAGIQPSLGSETFPVDPSSSRLNNCSVVSLVKVTGESGVQTSEGCDGAAVRSRSKVSPFLKRWSWTKHKSFYFLYLLCVLAVADVL